MGQPIRIMGKGDNEAIQAQVDSSGRLHVTLSQVKKEGYSISDTQLSGDPQYFGFLRDDGAYYIIQRNKVNGTWRYVQDTSGYALAWTNRTSQSYDYFNNVF